MTKSVKLSPEQEKFKDLYTPKPPDSLSGNALKLFNAAISKISFEPCNNNGLSVSYADLSTDELFAIGITGTNEWPLHIPEKVKSNIDKMQRTGTFFGVKCTLPATDPYHAKAINVHVESARENILVLKHSEKFPIGRQLGATGMLTKLVKTAVDTVGNYKLDDVISQLERMTDDVQEIDREDKQIWLREEEKPRSFKTVKNILSKIKNPDSR